MALLLGEAGNFRPGMEPEQVARESRGQYIEIPPFRFWIPLAKVFSPVMKERFRKA